jgi:peptidoglycan-associated lipoprotein
MSARMMFAVTLCSAAVGMGCHHRVTATAVTPTVPAPAPAVTPAPPAPPAAARTSVARPGAPLTEDELFRRKSLEELNAERPLNDVFFDTDGDTLRDEGRAALQRDAAWLSRWSHTRVLVEGHCDERGSAEYNLALGDRRAEIVKQYLTTLGVAPDRVEVRTLGKEAPFCSEEAESCWSQNRRGHFVITAK